MAKTDRSEVMKILHSSFFRRRPWASSLPKHERLREERDAREAAVVSVQQEAETRFAELNFYKLRKKISFKVNFIQSGSVFRDPNRVKLVNQCQRGVGGL